nr:hypothetical protein WG33_0061 [uncultured bacterium]
MYAPAIVARNRTLPLAHRIRAAHSEDETPLYNFCFVLQSVADMANAAAVHGCTTLAGFVRLAGLVNLE